MEAVKEKKEPLFEVKNVENSPFGLLIKDGKINIILKNQIVTDVDWETEEEAIAYIESKPWQLIMIASYIYSEGINEMKELMNQIKPLKSVEL